MQFSSTSWAYDGKCLINSTCYFKKQNKQTEKTPEIELQRDVENGCKCFRRSTMQS